MDLCLCGLCAHTLQVIFNPAEVSEVKYIELAELQQQMAAEPENFTEWFRAEAELLNLFGSQQATAMNPELN